MKLKYKPRLFRLMCSTVTISLSPLLADDATLSTKVERFAQSGAGALEEVREATTTGSGKKIMEIHRRDTNGDGHFDYTNKMIFAEGVRVFSEVKAHPDVNFRSYGTPGRLVMIEDNRNQDGVFETVVLYGEQKQITAVLTRTKDGEIVPASEEKTRLVLESKARFDKTVRPLMEAIIENTKDRSSTAEK